MNEKLKIEILAEIGKFKSAINEAKSQLNDFNDKTSKIKEKVSSAFSAIGKAAKTMGKVVAAGIGVATTGLVALGKQALESYGNYEQLIGGVETLFGKSADVIKKYADEAYKTAGLSANEYMETVTGFSASLLQSLNGDTAKAAESANNALIDMADNANKMGSTMESIQNAYAGFSKQNYTMLDNLKLGYGGTKEEMERLLLDAEKLTGKKYDVSNFNDITEAIHAIQTEMGITGTTAKEASTTIQGSITSMKGAWQNLVTGLMNPDADLGLLVGNMIETATTALNNIIPKIGLMLPQVSEAISILLGNIKDTLPPLIEGLLPTLIEASVSLVNGVVEAAPQLVSIIVGVLPDLIDGVVQITLGIVDAIPDLVETLCQGLIECMPQLINGAVLLFVGIVDAFDQIVPILIDNIPFLIESFIPAFINNIPNIGAAAIELFMAIPKSIPKILPALKDSFLVIIKSIKTNLVQNAKDMMKFDWNFPKLKLPHFSVTGEFGLNPPTVPKLSISWYAKGGVFDNPTLFSYGGNLGGLGENGAEAVVPLENNTKWMDILASKLSQKMSGGEIVLNVDGNTLARTTITSMNNLTKQTGSLGLVLG